MVISHTDRENEYLLIQNLKTGEQAIVDKRMSRYRRLCYGFLNSLKKSPRFVKHVVLTQAEESYHPKILNNFLNRLRRYYGDVVYLWTVETQKRGVLHWHIIVAFDYDVDFGKEDVIRIQSYWKYGQVEIIPVRNPNVSYLIKYITKSLDCVVGEIYKVRRIGSSKIEGFLRQSWAKLVKCIEYFMPHGISIDGFNDFFWQSGNAYLEERDEVLDKGGYRYTPHRVCVYRKQRSGWFKVVGYRGEAF